MMLSDLIRRTTSLFVAFAVAKIAVVVPRVADGGRLRAATGVGADRVRLPGG